MRGEASRVHLVLGSRLRGDSQDYRARQGPSVFSGMMVYTYSRTKDRSNANTWNFNTLTNIFVRKHTLHAYDWRGAAAAAAASAFDCKWGDQRGLERQSCTIDAVDADMSWLDELLVSERTRVLCCVRSLMCCVLACPPLPILEEALKKTVITSADAAVTTGRLFSHQVKASRAPKDQQPHERQVEWRRPFPPFAPFYCLPIAILARLL